MNINKNDIFIFFGPPGGGKGSLSKMCVDHLGWIQLSTGNLCRSHISRQTEIGKKIDFIIKSGKLIPDDLITDMIKDQLEINYDLNKTIIFDGYPRTLVQADRLNDLLSTEKFSKYKLNLVKLVINEESVIKRLCSRIVCSNNGCQVVYSTSCQELAPKKVNECDVCGSSLIKRHDDEEKVIKERLSVYSKHENQLIEYYSQIGKEILYISAEKPLIEIFEDFKNLISPL